jgi:hypothetical protein
MRNWPSLLEYSWWMIFEVMIAEGTRGTVESKLQVRNMSGPIYRKDAACFEGRSNLAGVGMREPSGCLHVR